MKIVKILAWITSGILIGGIFSNHTFFGILSLICIGSLSVFCVFILLFALFLWLF